MNYSDVTRPHPKRYFTGIQVGEIIFFLPDTCWISWVIPPVHSKALSIKELGGGFKYFSFSPHLGEMIQIWRIYFVKWVGEKPTNHLWTPTTHGKMQVLGPQYMGYNPEKWRKRGFPWQRIYQSQDLSAQKPRLLVFPRTGEAPNRLHRGGEVYGYMAIYPYTPGKANMELEACLRTQEENLFTNHRCFFWGWGVMFFSGGLCLLRVEIWFL